MFSPSAEIVVVEVASLVGVALATASAASGADAFGGLDGAFIGTCFGGGAFIFIGGCGGSLGVGLPLVGVTINDLYFSGGAGFIGMSFCGALAGAFSDDVFGSFGGGVAEAFFAVGLDVAASCVVGIRDAAFTDAGGKGGVAIPAIGF